MRYQRRKYLIMVAVLFLIVCTFRFSAAKASPEIELTAHRGDSAQYPENTMAAFQAAADLGVDYIELDVQQTSDHVLVVSHDQNLARTTGVHRNIREMRYQEIKKLDAGSWYSEKFSEERIPTLERVLKLAKKYHIGLNIEIKDSDSSGILEKKLIALLRQYHMQSKCLVASQDYQVLQQMKQYAPKITTVYVMDTVGEKIKSLQDADEISMPFREVTAELVKQAHTCGKKIHVWTVDTPGEIQAVTDLQVDDLITDDPALVMLAWNNG